MGVGDQIRAPATLPLEKNIFKYFSFFTARAAV